MKVVPTILVATLASSVIGTVTPNNPTYRADRQAMARTKVSPLTAKARPRGLPIINDDFEKARAEANKRKLPLFVEVWAPW